MASYRFARMLALLALGVIAACSDEGGNEADELPDDIAVVIGPEGGEVRAKGVKLEIPPGALDKELTITAKRTTKPAPPAVKMLSSVYEFGPEGTQFTKEVKVSFETEKTDPGAVVYFTKEGSSTQFEKLPSTRKEKEVSAAVRHFSLGLVGVPEEDDLPEPDAGMGNDLDAGAMLPDTGPVDHHDADTGPGPMPSGKRIRVLSSDWYGRPANQTWAAFRDGDGAWQALTPTEVGDYQFDVLEDTYAAAFVCGNDADAGSESLVILAPSTSTTQSVAASNLCVTAIPVQYTVSGTLTPPAGATDFAWGHPFGAGRDTLTVGGPPPAYAMQNFPSGVTVDPVVAALDENSFIMKANILRNLTLTENQTLAIDLANDGYSTTTAQFSVGNATADTDLTVHLATRNANTGLSLGWGAVGGTPPVRLLTYQQLQSPNFLQADNYVFQASEFNVDDTRWARLRTKTGGNISFDLPQPFSVSFARDGSNYLLPRMQFDSVPDAVHYRLSLSYSEGPVRMLSVRAEPGWLTLSQDADAGHQMPEHELALPDLSSAPGFDTDWLIPANATVYLTGGVQCSTNAAGGVLETYSDRGESSSIPY